MVAKSSSSKKAKGIRLEKDVSKKLRSAGFKSAKRQPMSGAISGFDGDVYCLELPFIFELKNQETWSPQKYMEQAEAGARANGKMPVVIMSKNRLPDPYVMMRFSDWINILQRAFIENKTPVLTGKQAYSKHSQLNRK